MVLGMLMLGIRSMLTAGAMACRAQTESKTERVRALNGKALKQQKRQRYAVEVYVQG